MDLSTMNWSSFFAGASLLLAVASPIITSVINYIVQKQERESRFQLQHKAEVFENYVRDTAIAISSPYEQEFQQYRKSYGEILLHTSGDLRQKIIDLDKTIYSNTSSDYPNGSNHTNKKRLDDFNAVCLILSEDNPRLKKKHRN